MSFKSAAENNEEKNQLAAVLSTAINKWLDLGTRFAVSCNEPAKLEELLSRLETFKSGITNSSFMEIAKSLVSEKIIDDYSELRDVDHHSIKRLMPHRDLYNKAESISIYLKDRMARLHQFIDETKHYRVNSEYDIFKIYDGIQDSLQRVRMKNICSCLANEAACIGRNLQKKTNLQHKNQLDDRCRQIVCQTVLKSRTLSL